MQYMFESCKAFITSIRRTYLHKELRYSWAASFLNSKSYSTVSPPLFIHMAKHPNSCTYTQYACVKNKVLNRLSNYQCANFIAWDQCTVAGCVFPCKKVHCKKCMEFLDFFYQTFLTLVRTYAGKENFLCYSKKGFFAVLPFWPLDPGSGMGKKSRS